MKLSHVLIFLFSLAFIVSACAQQQALPATTPAQEKPMMKAIPDDSKIMDKPAADKAGEMQGDYSGTHLAGTTSQYLSFAKADYEKALTEKKIVLLYFYASWCPICREEQKETTAFFDSLDREEVIGFRVNFKDSDTDRDEEALAKQFGVPYQHTKVILKDGKQVLKSLEQWNRKRYAEEIGKV